MQRDESCDVAEGFDPLLNFVSSDDEEREVFNENISNEVKSAIKSFVLSSKLFSYVLGSLFIFIAFWLTLSLASL